MAATRVSAVVLAGGRSSRFGTDKLRVPVDGRPLLQHAIEAVARVADEVLVVAAPGGDLALASGADPVRLLHDAAPHRGPVAGLRVGAAAARAPVLLVVGGDMPWLVPAVLEQLVVAVHEGHDAAVLADADGAPRPLPLAVRRNVVPAPADGPGEAGGGSLRGFLAGLDTVVIQPSAWRVADPDGRTLRDVDRPGDLPAG